jgi:hypothetical protein
MKRAVLLVVVAAAVVAPVASAARAPVDIDPTQVNFGKQPFESFTKKSFSVTNRSSETVVVTIEQVRVPDDFSPGQIESTCTLAFTDTVLDPGETCTHVIGFRPTPFFAGRELAILRVIVRDEAGNVLYTRDVRITGRGV